MYCNRKNNQYKNRFTYVQTTWKIKNIVHQCVGKLVFSQCQVSQVNVKCSQSQSTSWLVGITLPQADMTTAIQWQDSKTRSSSWACHQLSSQFFRKFSNPPQNLIETRLIENETDKKNSSKKISVHDIHKLLFNLEGTFQICLTQYFNQLFPKFQVSWQHLEWRLSKTLLFSAWPCKGNKQKISRK